MRFSQTMLMMAFVAMICVGTASADIVAQYTFVDGSASATNVLSPIVASNVSTSNAGISGSTDRVYAWGDDVYDGTSDAIPAPADAGTAYAEFTLAPSEDGMILDNIQTTVGVSTHGDVPDTGWTGNWAYYASTDGFATETYLGTASGAIDEANQSYQFDLSELGQVYDDLTIRMVAYYTSDTYTAPDYPKFGQIHAVYDMTVNGGVVPEPATMVLLSLGGVAGLFKRRRSATRG